ncbi:MAG: hypothetical protein LPK25_01775 [Cyclobacteriaceae bacterium]|nr:hypothetical protein [Cyclobacteriaceae bacterium]MDX5465524.1 hypothetical protein [Cyclobacteriaceae bacterium]
MSFFKNFQEGQQIILIDFHRFPEENFLEYRIGIRINAVEDLIQKFLPTISDYFERSITLIKNLDEISEKFPRKFSVKSERELTQSIQAGEEFFLNYGFDWMDQMSKPIVIEGYYANCKEDLYHNHQSAYNIFRGAVLAKLYNPSDYPTVKQAYLELVKRNEMTPFTIASFLQLLDYLDHLEIKLSS